MRKNPTRSEALVWRALCCRQLGARVRRQHVLAPFIVDFFVPSHRLVIEIDGDVHRSREARDAARTSELERLYDVRVLRLEASMVEREVFAAIWCIRREL